MAYPWRIRFWYWFHDTAARVWKWTWRTKLSPWHQATQAPLMPPSYRLIETIPATPEEQARGITARKIYVSRG